MTKKKKSVAKAPKKKTPAKKATSQSAKGPTGDSSLDMVRSLAAIVDEFGLSRIMIDRDGVCLEVERGGVVSQPAAVQATPVAVAAGSSVDNSQGKNGAATEAEADAHNVTIHSPFVGTFYSRPSPDAPVFVEVGQRIKKGQVLCIVEAMKLMNEIEAEVEGTIMSVLVTNDQTVEYNQPLFTVDPV